MGVILQSTGDHPGIPANGNDEMIEVQRGSIGEQDLLARCIHLDDFGK